MTTEDVDKSEATVTKTERTVNTVKLSSESMEIDVDNNSSDAKKLGEDDDGNGSSTSGSRHDDQHSEWVWLHAFYHSVVVCIGTGILALPYAVSSAYLNIFSFYNSQLLSSFIVAEKFLKLFVYNYKNHFKPNRLLQSLPFYY